MIKPHRVQFIIALLFYSSVGAQDVNSTKLIYDSPAKVWEEALPLGNGKLGAMVFGDPLSERFMLNEGTLWSGSPQEITNPKAFKVLPVLRKTINDGAYQDAAELWMDNAQGPYTARYLPMGSLSLKMELPGSTQVTKMHRALDISNATSIVTFEANGIQYRRKSFISYPDQVMVIRIEANKKQSINFKLDLESQLKYILQKEGNSLLLTGKAPKYVPFGPSKTDKVLYAEGWEGSGLNFAVRLKVLQEDGSQQFLNGNVLSVMNASSATIILSAATNYDGWNVPSEKSTKKPLVITSKYLETAEKTGYAQLFKRHIKDYSTLFNRVTLQLDSDPLKSKPTSTTDKRLREFAADEGDRGLVALYYNYGRYLLISSSRKGGLPANLQGIWNQHVIPPWGSNYTLDINTEMNYWMAETVNLPECVFPLLDFINSLSVSGANTARVNYHMKGWVSHQNSDAWAQSVPQGNFDHDKIVRAARWTCWPMSGSWFCRHLWDHYEFHLDENYLRNDAYPVMKGAAEFLLDWLVDDKETGYLLTNPSTSPENRFKYTDKNGLIQISDITKGSTMDMMLIWDLFTNCIKASEILNVDEEFRQQLEKVKKRLLPLQIAEDGHLQEWFKNYEDADVNHRHVSHLYGLYPGDQIGTRTTPELAEAARKSLKTRGIEGPAWSTTWKTALWARLEDGDMAYKALKAGMSYCAPLEKKKSGLYPSLLTAQPFQIDGNLGIVASITEMIIQSKDDEIFLLPALPANFPSGSLHGIITRGGYVVDLDWSKGKITKVIIHSQKGGNCRIRYTGLLVPKNHNANWSTVGEETVGDNRRTRLKPTHLFQLKTNKGSSYTLLGDEH